MGARAVTRVRAPTGQSFWQGSDLLPALPPFRTQRHSPATEPDTRRPYTLLPLRIYRPARQTYRPACGIQHGLRPRRPPAVCSAPVIHDLSSPHLSIGSHFGATNADTRLAYRARCRLERYLDQTQPRIDRWRETPEWYTTCQATLEEALRVARVRVEEPRRQGHSLSPRREMSDTEQRAARESSEREVRRRAR